MIFDIDNVLQHGSVPTTMLTSAYRHASWGAIAVYFIDRMIDIDDDKLLYDERDDCRYSTRNIDIL